MKSYRTLIIALAAAATMSLGAAMPVAAAQNLGQCLSDQEIQSQIQSGQIKSWPKIKKMAGITADYKDSDLRVCLINGVPFYSVSVISPSGDGRKILLNAVDGSN